LDYHAWNYRGRTLFYLGQIEQEIFSYEQAIKIKSDYQDAWHNLGLAKLNRNEYAEAITCFNKVIAINNKSALTYYYKAKCYVFLAEINLALENLEDAIKLDPQLCREKAKVDNDFQVIAEEPRFHSLLDYAFSL
ncbi:MAG: tetratricopeptide repeat protein, partial [Microcoleaceae cyanobacterium]